MRVEICPGPLKGTVRAVASKSHAHRVLICAALAEGETRLLCPQLSGDIEATARCLRALGSQIEYSGGVFRIEGIRTVPERAELDCGESGSTLRFLLPVVCALGVHARLKLRGRLPERPLSPLWEELERRGARLSRPERDVIETAGTITGGDYEIAADVSSQFISGLLFALARSGGGSIRLKGPMESAGYIRMTRRALEQFGAETALSGNQLTVSCAGLKSPGELETEGDWSAAAFWAAADALSPGVECIGLDADSAQGDKAVTDCIKKIRAGGAVIDARHIPDLVPVLAAFAAAAGKGAVFTGAGRLRSKESDRIKTTVDMINALGGEARETEDGLIVGGGKTLAGGVVDSAHDHRIAMSAAVASIGCTGKVTVLGAECADKSYPAFWDDFESLGGKLRKES